MPAGMSTPTENPWTQEAAAVLDAARGEDGGWPYHAGRASATEPTALALLALAGTLDAGRFAAGADWLAARQRPDGFFAASPEHQEPSWLTPLAGMAMDLAGRSTAVQGAADALLAEPTFIFSQFGSGMYGFDTTLHGWPWTFGGFSFLEPTALAVLFLKRQGYGQHARVREGVRLIRDRAIAGGGWNYGEPAVLGGALFPAEAPTALALLALADEPGDETAAGLDWLSGRLGQITSLYSLGWAATALNLLGRLDSAGRGEVVGRWNAQPDHRRDPVGTALCLLGLRAVEGHPLATAES